MWTSSSRPLLAALGLLCLLFGGTSVAQENGDRLDQVQEKGVLRVAVYRDFPPYSYHAGGHYEGIDVDLAKALANRLKLGMNLMLITADESMGDDLRNAVWKGHYLGGGVADVMMHVPVDPAFARENDRAAIFSPYLDEHMAVAFDRDQVGDNAQLLDLYDKRIGVELDTNAAYFLSSAYHGRLRASAERFLSITEALAKLKEGKVAAVLASRPQLENGLGEALGKRFRIADAPLQGLFQKQWSVGLAVKAGNPRLQAALNDAMAQLRADGTLAEILGHYHVSRTAMVQLEP